MLLKKRLDYVSICNIYNVIMCESNIKLLMIYNCNVHLVVACIVFYCTQVLRFYLIFCHLEVQTFIINHAMGCDKK
jgi:hypothetical protein